MFNGANNNISDKQEQKVMIPNEKIYAMPESLYTRVVQILANSSTNVPFIEMQNILYQMRSLKIVNIVEPLNNLESENKE